MIRSPLLRRLPSPAALLAAAALLAGAASCARTVVPPATPPVAPPAAVAEAPPSAMPGVPEAPEAPGGGVTPAQPLPAAEAVPPAAAPSTAAATTEDADLPPGPQVPILIRVGLASDLERLQLPWTGGELVAEAGGRRLAVAAPLTVTPGGEVGHRSAFRLQVAALRDDGQAAELARRLRERTGLAADSVFDAGVGLYRVRVGRFPSREAAEQMRRRRAGEGLAEAWVVAEGGEVRNPALVLTQGGSSSTVPGRWLSVRREADGSSGGIGDIGIPVLGKRYRGSILVYLNDRGSLNLVNEVTLEDYLRGVVPSEMGPVLYDRLEALKAQAVAARTYALRTLGEFTGEGYDLCATPRCQVYNGIDVEHPLSDRAVAETAGQVLLYRGELVDARYSSTCGGHTEDVEVVFPLVNYPYLRGVPCLEAGVDRVGGDLAAGGRFPDALTRRLFPPPVAAGTPEAVLAARLEALAAAAGLPVPSDRLASLARREVQRFVASVFDLALDARLFVAAEDLPYLLADPPADWSEEDRRRAAYLLRSGLLTGPPDRSLDDAEVEGMIFRLAELLRVVEQEEGAYRSLAGGRLTVQVEGEERSLALPAHLATFRRRGDGFESGPLALVAGDRLTLYRQGGELVALVQEVDLDGVAYDRTSRWRSWTRFRSDAQLTRLVEERYPGLGFAGLEVLSRGVSGRVGRLRVAGARGQTVDVEGLAVRWTLDLPDTRFTMKRLRPKNGAPGYLFSGSGLGHGVGMCQVGAFGMAGRGHGYREILSHYYTGVTLVRARAGAPRWTGVP